MLQTPGGALKGPRQGLRRVRSPDRHGLPPCASRELGDQSERRDTLPHDCVSYSQAS